MNPRLLLAPLACLAAPFTTAAVAQPDTPLARALTFHASFDTGLDADFSRGEKTAYVRTKTGLVPASLNHELALAPGAGRFGGALGFEPGGGFGFLGGISGVMMGTEQLNLLIHNTIYVPGHFHATVVIGTTLGMMIADVPAVFIGDRFAARIPMKLVHGIAAAMFAVMGLATLFGAGAGFGF